MTELSRGFIQLMASDNVSNIQPTLQVLFAKSLGQTVRWKVSDGIYSYDQCILDPPLSYNYDEAKYGYALIHITDYEIKRPTPTNGLTKFKFIVKSCDVVRQEKGMIGNPVKHTGDPKTFEGINVNKLMVSTDVNVKSPIRTPFSPKGTIDPIKDISLYSTSWTIEGVVSERSVLRNIVTETKEMKAMNFVLIDKDGSDIRLSCFEDVAETWNKKIVIGKVFKISGDNLSVKETNAAFNKTTHSFELNVRRNTVVEEVVNCHTIQIPVPQLKRTKLASIGAVKSKVVDIIGLVDKVVPVAEFKTLKGDKRRMEIHLIDESCVKIPLTLWDVHCDLYSADQFKEGQVIFVSGANVNDFRFSYVLSYNYNTRIYFDVQDKAETGNLKMWNSSVRPTKTIHSNCFDMVDIPDPYHTTLIANALDFDFGEEAHSFNVVGKIQTIIGEPFYRACLHTYCTKKVYQNEKNHWVCEACDLHTTEFRYVMRMSAVIGDLSGSKKVSLFENECSRIFKCDSETLGKLYEKELESDEYDKLIKKTSADYYMFKVKTKTSDFEGKSYVNWNVQYIKPIDLGKYTKAVNRACDELEAKYALQ
uniref:Replication protein A subunit n=1 Tax=Rhabditophanes sp. KR3021 TaxID=114890 RepID=A0AC35TG97_9BILA